MSKDLIPIRTVLMSVTDKAGLADFAQGLKQVIPEIKILASGGTFTLLKEAGLNPVEISSYTGFPECFNGRVKTLHPKIMGGILYRRDKDEIEAQQLGISPIDLVVCNLYDFEKAAQDQSLEVSKLVEKIDIGGSTLIRSSCKNHESVGILVDPQDYSSILEEIKENKGQITLKTRQKLLLKALQKSVEYEALLAQEFARKLENEECQSLSLRAGRKLRYGENPDQSAWVYSLPNQEGIVQAKILSGKEISYNNYDDATVAYRAAQNFYEVSQQCGVTIIKHGSLCAGAIAPNLVEAFEAAWEGDSKSAFGSVIAVTTPITEDLIPSLQKKFVEVMIAPGFSEGFVNWAKTSKPNLRLLELPLHDHTPLLYKSISGGMLVQTPKPNHLADIEKILEKGFSSEGKPLGVVSQRGIGNTNPKLFTFGMAVVHYVKSNTIAIVREKSPHVFQIIGMGAGQPNRVDSLERLAIPKAIENLKHEHADTTYDPTVDLQKCVLASDGFFPFEDSIRFAASKGIGYCIEPGGSIRDSEVIKAADELNVCLVFTGNRSFYH